MNTHEIETETEHLITRLCAGVIAHPESFQLIKTYSGASLTKYNMRAHAADCPRLMGRGGLRFRALRFVARAFAAGRGHHILLESLEEPEDGAMEPFPKFQFNPEWPKQQIQTLLDDTCEAVFVHPVETKIIEGYQSATLVITVSDREPVALLDEAAKALSNIFSGIGTTNGCQISIDINIKK